MQDAVPQCGTFGLDKLISQEEGCNHSSLRPLWLPDREALAHPKQLNCPLWKSKLLFLVELQAQISKCESSIHQRDVSLVSSGMPTLG